MIQMAEPPTFAEMAALVNSMPRGHRYTLRCGSLVPAALAAALPSPDPWEVLPFGAPVPLLGVDVIVAQELPDAWWELREDDRLIEQGFLTDVKDA